MGWDIDLKKDGKTVQVKPHQTGSILQAKMEDGNLVPADTAEACCCLTFNYGQVYHLVGFNMDDMNGKKAKETTKHLSDAVEKLGTQRYDDYWAPTLGNAGAGLQTLLSWAEEHPDATWEIT